MELIEMKRIVFLTAALLLLVANSAEARGGRCSGGNCYQPVYAAPVATTQYAQRVAKQAPAQPVKAAPVTKTVVAAKPVQATTVSYKLPVTRSLVDPVKVKNAGFSTATAQGVANIMAARGVVGHFGGNPGYEGCGMAGSPQAAYNICCYGNSGMATVDVGYAQGANGLWYCCWRYR
jgi:hypothetical protein